LKEGNFRAYRRRRGRTKSINDWERKPESSENRAHASVIGRNALNEKILNKRGEE